MKLPVAALVLLVAAAAEGQDPENTLPPGHPPIGDGDTLPPGHPAVGNIGDLPPGHPAAGALPPGHPAVSGADESPDTEQLLKQLDAMKETLKDRPKTAEIEYALGNLCYENGRYPDAIDYYRQLLERADGPMKRWLSARARPHRKVSVDEAGCSAAGKPSFDQLVAIADQKAAAGDDSAAVACYEAALGPVVVAKARRANAFFLIGNPDKAVAEHQAVLAIDPDFPESLFFLGAILYESGDGHPEKLREARDVWTRFLAAGPDADQAKLVRANLGKIAAALQNGGRLPTEAGAEEGPPPASGPLSPPTQAPQLSAEALRALDAAVAEGRRRLSARDLNGALAAFERARKIDPADPGAATGDGIALLELGRRTEAEAALRDALGRNPHDGLALYELGEVFFQGGHFAGAARFWRQLENEAPEIAKARGVQKRIAEAEAHGR